MKKILITGSTDGIGKMAAFTLAQEGKNVILHGRNASKLEKVVNELQSTFPKAQVGSVQADLSDFEDIKKMINQVISEYESLDVLINNAGIFKSPLALTGDGFDVRFMVNYFAPYLLSKGLMPLLSKSDKGRIINLSSAAQSPVSLKALEGREALSDQLAYAQSKLALTMWTFYLAKVQNSVDVVAVNPGSLLNTKMVQEAYGQFWSPASKGADILCALADSEQYPSVNGQYFDNDKGGFNHAHRDAYDQDKLEALIEKTNQLLSV